MENIIEFSKKYISIIIGSLIFAAGLEFFLIPNNILDGGVIGVSIIARHYIGLPLGVFIFLFNIPFLFLGYKQIGKGFSISSVIGIIVLSVDTSYLHKYTPLITDKF